MNTRKIKMRMAELGMTNKALAEAVGRTPQHMSNVVNGRKPLTLRTALAIQEALAIPDCMFDVYFLSGKDD